ncbi:hypothetical protein [Streptomyces sp. A 4/2]|nr:hypothetical protein [Streptomyces sp. A 4/2]
MRQPLTGRTVGIAALPSRTDLADITAIVDSEITHLTAEPASADQPAR